MPDWLPQLADLNQIVVDLAGNPWVLLALAIFCLVDAIIPMVPSESLIITLVAISMSGGGQPIPAVIAAGAAGAWVGDQITFRIGRWIPLSKIAFMNTPRGLAMVEKVRKTIHRRVASLLVGARFVPGGRVAVNLSAGATDYPQLRFMRIDGFAVIFWACYAALLGAAAGAYLHNHPLLAAAVGVTLGVLMGLLLDRLISWWNARTARPDQTEQETDQEPEQQ